MDGPNQIIDVTPTQTPGFFIIIGLGNPGRKFESSRHNVGFMLLNRLAGKLGENFSKVEAKALLCKTSFRERPIILAKPQTYMNNSGVSVASLVRFYQVCLENLLVIYDDVDLPLGILRLRPSGSSGGQKGMKSIIERLGSEEFPRMRIGTGRPPGRMDAADYVLRNFPSQEIEVLNETLDRGVEAVLSFISDGLDKTMNAFNG